MPPALRSQARRRRPQPDGIELQLAGWPGSERPPDLPLVPERVDDSSEPPSVLVVYRRGLSRAGRDRLPGNCFGIVDDEQHPAGCAVDGSRAETPQGGGRRCHPERCFTDSELSDGVVSFTHSVQNRCAERRLVEGDGVAWPVDPELRLDARHAWSGRFAEDLA